MYTLFCRKRIKRPTKKLCYEELLKILQEVYKEINQEGLYPNEYKLITDLLKRIDDKILIDKKEMRLEIPLKTFLAMYIGGDYKDECVFVPANDHEERITIFDGTEIVTAFWLDLDGKTWKLFVEIG